MAAQGVPPSTAERFVPDEFRPGGPAGVVPGSPAAPSGGFVPQQFQTSGHGPPSRYETLTPAETLKDVGQAIVSKPGEAAISLPGLPGDISRLAVMGVDWAKRQFTGGEPLTEEQIDERVSLPMSHQMREAYEEDVQDVAKALPEGVISKDFKFYDPKSRIGNIVGEAAGGIPAAMLMGGGLATALARGGPALTAMIRDALRYGAFPGAAGEGAGQFTEGTPAEPWARILTALLASADPRKIATPNPITDPVRRQAVTSLDRQGVSDLTAGQRTGKKSLLYRESEIGGHAFENLTNSAKEQFNQAALSRVGFNNRRVTSDLMDRIFDDVGQEFDDLTRNYHIDDTTALGPEFARVIDDHFRLGRPESEINGLRAIANDVGHAIDPMTGTITGRAYQNLRSRIETLARDSQSNPTYAMALRDFRNALDNAMETSIAHQNPDDFGAFQQARNRYRDTLVIEQALASAPAKFAEGFIDPAALDNARKTVYGRRNWVRGRDNFSDLAQAGRLVMKEPPNSGTAARLTARGVPGAATGTAAGLGVHAVTGDPLTAALSGIAATSIPYWIARAALSRPGRAYLANQWAPSTPATWSGLATALANSGAWRPEEQ